MSENKDRKIISVSGGMLNDLAIRIKLILRLMADSRVHPLLKLIPVGSFLYLIFPDLLPGPVEDVAIIWLGTYLFVELCPPEVVQEHMEALKQVVPAQWNEAQEGSAPAEPQIIEGEFWEKEGQPKDTP
jgi:hypothetical protein